jgi:hypothetical protein
MKIWHIFIGIVVILVLVCSPVLAISKADLISQYKEQSSPTIPTPIPTPTSFADNIPSTCPENLPSCPSVKPYIPDPTSPAIPFHFGEAAYNDLNGNLFVNGSNGLWGFYDLPYIKPQWTGASGLNGVPSWDMLLDYPRIFA